MADKAFKFIQSKSISIIEHGIKERYFDGRASTGWRGNGRTIRGIVVFMGTRSVCNSSEGYRVERNSASREPEPDPGRTIARNPGATRSPPYAIIPRPPPPPLSRPISIYPREATTASVPLASYFEVGTPTLRCGTHPSRPDGSFPRLLLSTRMR